jgi:hypothetical protein
MISGEGEVERGEEKGKTGKGEIILYKDIYGVSVVVEGMNLFSFFLLKLIIRILSRCFVVMEGKVRYSVLVRI